MSYSSTVLGLSPLRYYRLGETSGTTVIDSSSSAQNGTYVGSPTLNSPGLLAGDSNTAVVLNGSSQYATIPTTGLPSGNGAWTMAALANPTNSAGGGALCSIGDATSGNGHLAVLAQNGSSGWQVFIWGGTVVTGGTAVAGIAHLVVATYDGINLRVYVDGSLVAGPTAPGITPSIGSGHANIGALFSTSLAAFFSGTVDEVAIWGSALTATQIGNLWAAAIGVPITDSGAGGNSVAITDLLTLSDPASGGQGILTAEQFTVPDNGSELDAVALTEELGVTDFAAGLEATSTTAQVSVTDQGLDSDGSAINYQLPGYVAIADSIARTLLDLEYLFLTNPTNVAPTLSTIINGQTGASNSLESRIANLPNIFQQADLASPALQAAANVVSFLSMTAQQFYNIYGIFLVALDKQAGGLNTYLGQSGYQVHPEFANAFNLVAGFALQRGLTQASVTPIAASHIFPPGAQQTLGSIAVTGSTSGTFSAGTSIDTTRYASQQLYLLNTGASATLGTATQFQITYVNAAGSPVTATTTLSGSLPAGAEQVIAGAIGSQVQNIVVISGGANGDQLSVVVYRPRTVQY